ILTKHDLEDGTTRGFDLLPSRTRIVVTARPPAAKEPAVSGPGRPSCAPKMALKRPPRPLGLAVCVNVQHDPRHLAPVGARGSGIQQAHKGGGVLLIVNRKVWARGRQIGAFGIVERRHVRPLPGGAPRSSTSFASLP